MRIRRPSALPDSTGRTCANAWRPALSRTTFLLRTPTELRKVRQLSWQQSRASECTAAATKLPWQPLCPKPSFPSFGGPSLAHSRLETSSSSYGPGRLWEPEEEERAAGDSQSGAEVGAGRARSQGARAGGTRPYLSFPPAPHLRRRARSAAPAVWFSRSPRVASLTGRGWLWLSGINPRQTESHGRAQ